MKKRLTYEAPQARDLSGFGVSGQWPLGLCTDGGAAVNPDGGCNAGLNADNTCTAGWGVTTGPPSLLCANGSVPGLDQCGTGQSPT